MVAYGRQRIPGKVDAAGFGPAYRAAVLRDSPVVLWMFDEPSGSTVVDHSGNGRDGTTGGTVSREQPGLRPAEPTAPSSGLSAGDVTLADAAWMDVSYLSAEVIVQIAAYPTPDNLLLLARYDTGGLLWHLAMNTAGTVFGAVRNNSSTYQSTNSVTFTAPLNQPLHIAFTRDTTTIKLFVNGVIRATGSVSGTALTGTSAITVNKAASSGFQRGNIRTAGAAVFLSALTDAQIAAHAAAAGLSSVT